MVSSVCVVLSLLAAVPALLPSAVLAQTSTQAQAFSPVSRLTPGSLNHLAVIGIMKTDGSFSLYVQNFGPGSVSLTTVDESNSIVSSATISQDDSLTSQTPFDASNEMTFIFAAANGTEVFRQTVNGLTYTIAPEADNDSILNLKMTTKNVVQLTFSNPLLFDLVATIEHEGEQVDASETVIPPRASLASGRLQLTFLQQLSEGDGLYASLRPKDESHGTGVVGFVAITNCPPIGDADRRRRLRAIEGMAIEGMARVSA